MLKYKVQANGVIESGVEPKDWFRFEEPYKSPQDGPSYVSGEDAKNILEMTDHSVAEAVKFYRLRGASGNYTLTPVGDNSLVAKLTEHRRRLVMEREHNSFIGSTGGFGLAESLRPLSELRGEI